MFGILLKVLDEFPIRYKMKPRLLSDVCEGEHLLAPARFSSFISLSYLYRLCEIGFDPSLI